MLWYVYYRQEGYSEQELEYDNKNDTRTIIKVKQKV